MTGAEAIQIGIFFHLSRVYKVLNLTMNNGGCNGALVAVDKSKVKVGSLAVYTLRNS